MTTAIIQDADCIANNINYINAPIGCPSLASHLTTNLPKSRMPLTFFHTRPWNRKPLAVFPTLEGIDGKGDDPDTIRRSALSRARTLNSAYNIYTDGSAKAGTSNGGAAAVVTSGDPESPTVVATLLQKGALLTCSYEEELQAMQMAADWLVSLGTDQSATIFTDSQSLCMALKVITPTLDPLREKLLKHMGPVVIQWIPGHVGIPGNELADTAAKAATTTTGLHRGVSYVNACAAAKRLTKDPPITHQRTRSVYASLSKNAEKLITSRSDQTLLAKLRSGHYIGL